MILIIRGHIRNAFKTQNLYNLIEMLYNIFPELNIFIHTWNIFSNNISWREIPINGEIVSEDIICNYFGKLNNCIKHIIIEDDKNIRLHGNLEGTINFVSGKFTSEAAEAETIVPFANAETKDTFLILSEFNFASGAYVKLEKKSNLLVNFVLKFKPAFTATPDKLD